MNDPTEAIAEISPGELSDLLHRHAVLLVDVREPNEYAAERIPGALLYPLSTLDASALPPDAPRRVVFHCAGGKRSEMAARARLAAGALTATHLAGGIAAWKAAGLATHTSKP